MEECNIRQRPPIFILLFATFFLPCVTSAEVWSFSPYGEERVGMVPTDRKVMVSYNGTGSVTWQADTHYCSIEDSSQAFTTLTCEKPGIHRLGLTVTATGESESRYYKFWNNRECYTWVAKRHGTSTTQFQLWIADLNEAVVPQQEMTERSFWLTEQFALTGQFPDVKMYCHGLYESDTDVTCQNYDVTAGYWLCTIGGTFSGEINIHVRSGDVPLMACSLRDQWMSLYLNDLVLSTPSHQVSITTSAVASPYIAKSPNIDGLAVWVDSSTILVTADSFQTAWSPVIPASSARTEQLVGIAFTWSKLVILTDAYLYFFLIANHTVENEIANTDITAGPLVGIRGYDWASEKLILLDSELIVVWTSSSIYLVHTNGTATELALSGHYPNTYTTPTVSIQDVAFNTPGSTLGILVKLSEGASNEIYLFTSNLELDIWTITDVTPTLTNMHTFTWRLIFRMQAHASIYVWSDNYIIGCAGNETFVCALLEEHNSGNDTLHSVWGALNNIALSHAGDGVFMTSENAMFYTKMASDNTVQVPSGQPTTTETIPYFDSLNNLLLVTLPGASFTTRIYSLDNEVFSALYPNISCQVLHFDTNMDKSVYFIDMGGQLELWAAVVRRNTEPYMLQIHTEGTGRWNLNDSSNYLTHKDVTLENKTLTVFHEEDYTGISDYSASLDASKGHISVEFGVTESLNCPPRRPPVASVSIGCYPGRMIQIMGKNENCERIQTFTIQTLENGQLVNETLPYDWDALGCPIRVKSGRKFVPRLGLYDDGVLIETVPSDFIMWELYDQPFIEYNTSMKQAGCIKVAQTWQSMISLASSGASKDDVWGPQNYEDCFTSSATTANVDLSQTYQIFNMTNFVAVEFSAEYDGIYIFRAKIIDPNYRLSIGSSFDFSFCSLVVDFAVEVYGTLPLQNVTLLVNSVMCFIGVFMALLVLSYIRLRFLLIKEQREDEEDEEEKEENQVHRFSKVLPLIKLLSSHRDVDESKKVD